MSAEQKRGFDEILQPIVRSNFAQQPSAGPAFAQMTSQTYAAMTSNRGRLGDLARADSPVKLI